MAMAHREGPLTHAIRPPIMGCVYGTVMWEAGMSDFGALGFVRRLLSGLLFVTLAVAQSNAPANPSTSHRVLRPFGEAGSKIVVTGFVVRRDDKYFAVQLADMRILRLRIGPETKGHTNGRTVDLDTYRLGDVVRVDAE